MTKHNDDGPSASVPPQRRSNAPLIIIFVLVGVILLAGLGYAAMVASGPMPGMGH